MLHATVHFGATCPIYLYLQGGEYTQQTYRQQADMFKQHWLLRHPEVQKALQDALMVCAVRTYAAGAAAVNCRLCNQICLNICAYTEWSIWG